MHFQDAIPENTTPFTPNHVPMNGIVATVGIFVVVVVVGTNATQWIGGQGVVVVAAASLWAFGVAFGRRRGTATRVQSGDLPVKRFGILGIKWKRVFELVR